VTETTPAGSLPTAARGTATGTALVMTLVCGAQFVLQLDFSIVNVALPTIQRELHMASANLQWIVTGYALTFGSLLLAGGRLADLFGRRRMLAVGLVVFAVASLGCGLAQWSVMLIISRVVQGAAGALVSPAALSLLTTTNPEGPARNRALSIWQATTAAGATTGIVAGGLLTQYLGWRAVFLVNPPLIAAMLAFFGRLPAGAPAGGSRVDVRGALLVTTAIAALIFGLSNGQQHGFATPATIAAVALGVLLGAGFVAAEKAAATPMLPLNILVERTRRAAVAAMLMIGAILAGYVYFVSLYLQKVLGFSPVATGLSLVPSTLTVVLISTLVTRRLLARFAIKYVLLAGLVSMAGGQAWLSQISSSSTYPAAVLPRPAAHLAGHWLGLAHCVDRHHQRRRPSRPGPGRGTVHHQPADRGSRGPGHPGHRRGQPHRSRVRVARRRLPALVPRRHGHRGARRCAGRDPAQLTLLPARTGPPAGGRECPPCAVRRDAAAQVLNPIPSGRPAHRKPHPFVTTRCCHGAYARASA
jgi:MFS family permease